jgi:hypothetical protein
VATEVSPNVTENASERLAEFGRLDSNLMIDWLDRLSPAGTYPTYDLARELAKTTVVRTTDYLIRPSEAAKRSYNLKLVEPSWWKR